MVDFIADIGANGNQSLARCFALVDAAYEAGCTGVKAQLFRAKDLYVNPPPGMENRELPRRFIPQISTRCHDLGMKFGCTPFHLDDVEFLSKYVDFFKIASSSILRKDLIDECSADYRTTYISLGLMKYEDFEDNDYLNSLWCGYKNVWFLRCTSKYPALPEECNLMGGCESKIHGWSDHSRSPGVIYNAVFRYRYGLIEFHLDLEDRKGLEYPHGHCWTPSQIAEVIKTVADGFAADNGHCDVDLNQREDPSDGKRPMKVAR